MKKTIQKKINRKNTKRILALILALSLLPWSDYASITAYAMKISEQTQELAETVKTEKTEEKEKNSESSSDAAKETVSNSKNENKTEESTERTTDDMAALETEGISEAETEDITESTEQNTESTTKSEAENTTEKSTEATTAVTVSAIEATTATESATEAETRPYKKTVLKNADKLEITEDTQLEKDITVESLAITSGILRLNGYTLTVNKGVSIEGGTLFVDGGELIIGEALHISGNTDNTALRMADENDSIIVNGDFIYEGQQKADVTAGTLILCSDITYAGNAGEKFTGNHTTIFAGKEAQKAHGTESFELNNVIFKNNEVTGLDAFVIKGCVDDCDQTIQGRINAGSGISYADGVYHGDVIYKESTYTQKDTVCIEGNVTFERVDTYYSYGEYTYLDVNGDFEWSIEPNHTAESNLIRVAGNVLLKKYGSYEKDTRCIFKIYMILDGNTYQEAVGTGSCYIGNSWINIKSENHSLDGVRIKGFTGNYNYIAADKDCIIAIDDYIPGRNGWILREDEIFDGDLVICAGGLDLNGHSLTVNGNLIIMDGWLSTNKGHLTVNGDVCVEKVKTSGERIKGNGKIYVNCENALMDINGNLCIRSKQSQDFSVGTVQISGDIVFYCSDER